MANSRYRLPPASRSLLQSLGATQRDPTPSVINVLFKLINTKQENKLQRISSVLCV